MSLNRPEFLKEILSAPKNKLRTIYPEGSPGSLFQKLVFYLFLFMVGLTVCIVFHAERYPHSRPICVIIFSFLWAFLPPLWFWIEFVFIFPRWAKCDTLDILKESQRLALAIWAPIAISLAAYGNSDYFKEKPENKLESSIHMPIIYTMPIVCNNYEKVPTTPIQKPVVKKHQDCRGKS